MSICTNNSNSIGSGAILDKVINQILGGYQLDALKRLKKCGLFTDEQIAKIQKTLQEVNPTHLTTTAQALKDRILIALNPDVKMAQTFPQAKIESHCFKDRCHLIMPQLPDEIISEIFKYSFSRNDLTGIYALACTNKYFNHQITKLVGRAALLDLNQFCPGLRILDAQTLQIEVDDEPPIKKLATIQCFQDMAPHVESNAGLTLLTIPKGLTFNQLVKIAESGEITVGVLWGREELGDLPVEHTLGDLPVEHTYRVVITNNIFINSRNMPCDAQEKLALEIGCEMPTVQEYVALCIFTKKIFNTYLYNENPWTLGRSSTRVDKVPVVVGSFAGKSLTVGVREYTSESLGAGGRRK